MFHSLGVVGLLSQSSASSPDITDWLQAIGTVVAGIFAIVAIVVTIWLSRRDSKETRRRAEEEAARHAERLREGQARYAEERRQADEELNDQYLRLRAENERLFRLQAIQRVIDACTYLVDTEPGSARASGARARLQVDVRMLPADAASLVRFEYELADNLAAEEKRSRIAAARGGVLRRPVPADWIFSELADDTQRIALETAPPPGQGAG